jgi:hypothetical protein
MPVRGGFIGEFCATIIAFVFPATIPRRPASASATASTVVVVVTSVTITIHIACHY